MYAPSLLFEAILTSFPPDLNALSVARLPSQVGYAAGSNLTSDEWKGMLLIFCPLIVSLSSRCNKANFRIVTSHMGRMVPYHCRWPRKGKVKLEEEKPSPPEPYRKYRRHCRRPQGSCSAAETLENVSRRRRSYAEAGRMHENFGCLHRCPRRFTTSNCWKNI
jgi:hypothetical protein